MILDSVKAILKLKAEAGLAGMKPGFCVVKTMTVGTALIGEHKMTVISSAANATSGLALLQALSQSAQNQTIGGAQANTAQTNKTVSSATEAFQAITANDPANAVKAILAQAQLAQEQTGKSSGGSASSVTVAAAYASQTQTSASVTNANDLSSDVSDIAFQSETSQTSVSQSTATVDASMTSGSTTMNDEVSVQSQMSQSSTSVLTGVATANEDGDIQSLDYMSVTRVPIGPIITQSANTEISSASGIAETTYNEEIGVYENQSFINADVSSLNVPAQTDSSSFIQIGRSIADTAVDIGFSVDNLGPMVNDDGSYSPANPQGTYVVQLQMNFDAAQGTANEGESCTSGGEHMNITGLTLSQAQDIMNGFEQATGGDSGSDNSVGSTYLKTDTVSGMDVNLSAVIANPAPQ